MRRPTGLVALAAGAFLLGGPPCPGSQEQATGASAPVARALLVGATRYPFLRDEAEAERVDLRGPVNDVALFRETLVAVLGLPESRIQTLAGWPDEETGRPTLANLRRGLERLAEECGPGELVIVFLAGHGVQQPAAPDDAVERDGLDEVFLPADAAPDPEAEGMFRNALTDNELGQRLAAIRDQGARVWLVVDSCHSATLQRGGEEDAAVRTRTLPPEIHSAPAARGTATAGDAASADPVEGLVAFYAAQSYQKAPEMQLPRGAEEPLWRGFFSYQLASALARLGPGATFQEVFELVKAGYASYPCHVRPAAEGRIGEAILGGVPDGLPLLVTREEGRRPKLWLNAGSLRGLVTGTRVRLFPVGRRGEEGASLGDLEVLRTDWTRSECILPSPGEGAFSAEGNGPWAAELQSVPVSADALQVSFHDREGQPLEPEDWPQEMTLAAADHRLQVVDPLVAEVEVRLGEGDVFLRRRSDDSWFTAPLADLHASLFRLFRVKNLLRLAEDGLRSPFPSGLEVTFQVTGADGVTHPLQEGERCSPGDLGRIQIDNRMAADQERDLWLFLVRSDASIDLAFPRGGSPQIRGRDRSSPKLTGFFNTDDTVGPEVLLSIALPVGSAPLDYLTQRGLEPASLIRGQARTPGNDLLTELAYGGTRGVRVRVEGDVPAARVLSYRTAWPSRLEPWARGSDAVPLDQGEVAFSLGPGLEAEGPAPGGVVAFWSSTASQGGADVVLAGQEHLDWFLVDLDGDTPLPGNDPGAARRRLAAGGFDAELAIHACAGGQRVFLDRDGDGRFDEVRRDRDRDGYAESRWRRDGEAGAWTEGVHLPWLQLSDLPFPDHRARLGALQRVRGLFAAPGR